MWPVACHIGSAAAIANDLTASGEVATFDTRTVAHIETLLRKRVARRLRACYHSADHDCVMSVARAESSCGDHDVPCDQEWQHASDSVLRAVYRALERPETALVSVTSGGVTHEFRFPHRAIAVRAALHELGLFARSSEYNTPRAFNIKAPAKARTGRGESSAFEYRLLDGLISRNDKTRHDVLRRVNNALFREFAGYPFDVELVEVPKSAKQGGWYDMMLKFRVSVGNQVQEFFSEPVNIKYQSAKMTAGVRQRQLSNTNGARAFAYMMLGTTSYPGQANDLSAFSAIASSLRTTRGRGRASRPYLVPESNYWYWSFDKPNSPHEAPIGASHVSSLLTAPPAAFVAPDAAIAFAPAQTFPSVQADFAFVAALEPDDPVTCLQGRDRLVQWLFEQYEQLLHAQLANLSKHRPVL